MSAINRRNWVQVWVWGMRAVLAVLLLVILSGCPEVPPASRESSDGLEGGAPRSRSRSSEEFRERAKDLQQHMTTAEVEWLLGRPSRTSTTTVGQTSAGGAWSALIWCYDHGRQTFQIHFYLDEEQNVRQVNSWAWKERWLTE